jgi:DNA-binding MarR family transcriptional regulator
MLRLDREKIFRVETAEESPGFLLWQVSSLWQRKINAGLRPYGLTHAQFVLLASLMWLGRQEKPITQAELAVHAKMDVMMTSNVLRTLEGKGLLVRNAHPIDSRAKALSITEQGRTLVVPAIQTVEEIDQIFFQKLGEDMALINQGLLVLVSKNQSEE